MDQLFQILVNGGVVLGLFVILLLNNKGVRKTRANTFLSILLGSLTFSTLHLRYAGDVMHHFSLRAYTLGDPTFLVIAPLLWFYIVELTGGQIRLSIKTLLHFVPFLLIIICSVTLGSFPKGNILADNFNRHPHLPITLFWILIVVQFSIYQFLIQRKWSAYQAALRQEVSNVEHVSLSWVRFFMTVFLIVNICFLVSLFLSIHFNVANVVWKIIGMVFSLSIFALGYKGILQREIFNADLPVPESIPTPLSQPTAKPQQELIDKLTRFMEEQRPYIDPELSLSTLSKQLGINRNQLSQLINIGLGENFYDFINKYRIEEVKRLMADPQKQNYNLLGMALEAGFKSKSTFNLIFKRFTGLTPSEYKKNSVEPDVQ